jgi:hypothetical protein
MEDQIRQAITTELERQAETRPDKLKVRASEDRLELEGEIDLDELTAAIVGAVAGGP